MRAKLTDFGLSAVKTETASTTKTDQASGTVRWMAPELFQRQRRRRRGQAATDEITTVNRYKKADMYSYGMVLWELASRNIPYSDEANEMMVMSWIKEGELEEIPEDCPESFANLISRCWETRPEARPTIDQAAKHLGSILQTDIEVIENTQESEGPDYDLQTRIDSPSYELNSGV